MALYKYVYDMIWYDMMKFRGRVWLLYVAHFLVALWRTATCIAAYVWTDL